MMQVDALAFPGRSAARSPSRSGALQSRGHGFLLGQPGPGPRSGMKNAASRPGHGSSGPPIPAAIKPYPLRNCGSLRPKSSPNTSASKYLISSSVGMHMTNRMGNAGTAILIGAIATVTLVGAMNGGAAHAADNCLAGPKGAAPKGSHWYYRIDRATKRNCWYVRAEGEKPVSSQSVSVAEVSPPPQTPLQPVVANARAEATAADIGQPSATGALPDSIDAADNAQGSDAPAADSGQSTVASRWLDQAGADTINALTAQPADAGASPNSSTTSIAAIPLAAADMRSASSGSVSTLFLVIVGALAVAALFAGVILRFGNARRNEPDDAGTTSARPGTRSMSAQRFDRPRWRRKPPRRPTLPRATATRRSFRTRSCSCFQNCRKKRRPDGLLLSELPLQLAHERRQAGAALAL